MKKWSLLLCVFLTPFILQAEPLLNIMDKELKRNFNVLKRQNPPIYYLSYMIEDSSAYSASATLGDMIHSTPYNSRELNVTARSGARTLDNTHEFKGIWDGDMWEFTYSAAMENNAVPLENLLWRATDEAAKNAQDKFLKVKANASLRTENEDKSPDFSAPLKPFTDISETKTPEIDTALINEQLKKYSALAKGHAFIIDGSVSFYAETAVRYLVTSEGVKIKKGGTLMRLRYNFYGRNADGMDLQTGKTYSGFSLEDLPSPEVITADIKKDIEILKNLINAPVIEPYTGPAILKNKASGVFFHEILGHRVEGHRQKSENFGQTFTKKLNQQVVSPLISVYDDPTLSHWGKTPLRGHYLYDDEGVKAQRVNIIENGILKNFLMSRTPIENFALSNGHARKQMGRRAVSRMGNTIIEAKDPVPFEKLRELLIAEAKKQGKEYGLLIEDVSGGLTQINRNTLQTYRLEPTLVYKVYVDGRPDEMVRGVGVTGTPLMSFNKIAAAATDVDVFNGDCGAESGWVPVSAVSPSILVSEIEVEKTAKSSNKVPILKPAHAEGK